MQLDPQSQVAIRTVHNMVRGGDIPCRGQLQEVIDIYKRHQIPVPYAAYRRAYVAGYDVEGLTIVSH